MKKYPPSGEWLPIATAPQDSTIIDIWSSGDGRLANYRRRGSSPNVFYDPVYSGVCVVRDATHWMPLPVPPNDKLTDGGHKNAMNSPETQSRHSVQRLVMPTVEELNRNFETALEIRLHGEYLRGKVEGIRVAKLIRDWLTRQPDRMWQKQVREWADKEIANAEREWPNEKE